MCECLLYGLQCVERPVFHFLSLDNGAAAFDKGSSVRYELSCKFVSLTPYYVVEIHLFFMLNCVFWCYSTKRR